MTKKCCKFCAYYVPNGKGTHECWVTEKPTTEDASCDNYEPLKESLMKMIEQRKGAE